jgi:hypothetical protein
VIHNAWKRTPSAAHQSQLYGALQRAYEDLRQTQQTVMQQERLRAASPWLPMHSIWAAQPIEKKLTLSQRNPPAGRRDVVEGVRKDITNEASAPKPSEDLQRWASER